MNGKYNIQVYRNEVERRKGVRDRVVADKEKCDEKVRHLNTRLDYIEEARTIIQTVAQLTQEELEYHISELVTLAMSAVFDEPYALKLNFVLKRGKTEAVLTFYRDGAEFDPMADTGGGPVDVAAFALRVAMWNLQQPRSRNVLVLDEPFRFLSRNLQGRASAMLTEISNKLGLQIIMVSHNPELIEGAHKTFQVTLRKGVSHVETT
jgi:DNA repair exonuclease SbcCD ATPase subunit